MIGRAQLQAMPAFCFTLPPNTPARAVPPDAAESWLSVHDRLWVRQEIALRRSVTAEAVGTVGEVAVEVPGWSVKTEGGGDDEAIALLVQAAAKDLVADLLTSIRDQLAASVPDVVLSGQKPGGRFPALAWPAAGGRSRDGQRKANSARLDALRSHAAAVAALPAPGAGELSDDALAAMLSRRLCQAFARLRCPAPAEIYVRPEAKAPEPHMEWRTQGDFDLLWGARYLEFQSNRVHVRDWADSTMRTRLNLGMARHLLAMASGFERAFGGCDAPLRFGIQLAGPGQPHGALLIVDPSAWGFDLAATAALSAVSALPKGLDLTWTAQSDDPA